MCIEIHIYRKPLKYVYLLTPIHNIELFANFQTLIITFKFWTQICWFNLNHKMNIRNLISTYDELSCSGSVKTGT